MMEPIPPDPEEQAAWERALAQPATRGDLMQVIHLTHLIFLSHSAFEAMLLHGTDEQIREAGARAVETSGQLLKLAKEMTMRWTSGDE